MIRTERLSPSTARYNVTKYRDDDDDYDCITIRVGGKFVELTADEAREVSSLLAEAV